MNALDDFATCDKCKIMTISLHCIKDYKVSCVIVNKENKEDGKFSATTWRFTECFKKINTEYKFICDVADG